jgi:hypothetical protein
MSCRTYEFVCVSPFLHQPLLFFKKLFAEQSLSEKRLPFIVLPPHGSRSNLRFRLILLGTDFPLGNFNGFFFRLGLDSGYFILLCPSNREDPNAFFLSHIIHRALFMVHHFHSPLFGVVCTEQLRLLRSFGKKIVSPYFAPH